MTFRIATPEDIPAMLAIYRPYVEETSYSFEYTTPTETEMLSRFGSISAAFPWLVCEEEGEILGYAYAAPAFERAAYMWDADLSVYISPVAHRRGIGRCFYYLLENILRLQGYHNVYALVTSSNPVSIAFHQSSGYELMTVMPAVGYKFDAWHDMYWFHKRLLPATAPSAPPAPFCPKMLEAVMADT